MKVLTVHTEYARGGAAMVALSLHNAINSDTCDEGFFVYGKGEKSGDPRSLRFAYGPEVCLHGIITRLSGIQGFGTFFSSRRLKRIINDWRPDIIHFHNIHGYYLDFGITEYVRRSGIPVVWTVHDGWPLTGRCTYLNECVRWEAGCGSCSCLGAYPASFIDSSAMMWRWKRNLLNAGWYTVIVSPSKWLAKKISEATLGKRNIVVISNGVDSGAFRLGDRAEARNCLGLPSDKRIVLFSASDLKVKEKGAKYFFDSLSYVKAEDWMVVTVGEMADIPAEFKGNAEIRQLGYMAGREKMALAYSAADVFCTTSLEENFPTVVLEAMSCGIPVVGFNVGGITEQVGSDCGRLVTSKHSKALGRELSELLNDRELREGMGRKGRDKVLAQYDEKVFVERYFALYRELIEAKD